MADTPSGGGEGRRWLRIALIASLAVNLLLLGAIGTRWIGHERDHRHERGSEARRLPIGLNLYARAMDDEARAALEAAVAAQRDTFDTRRAGVRSQMEGLMTAIVADPFDPQQMAAALATQRAAMGDYIGHAHGLLVEQVSEMNADSRQNFAEGLRREIEKRRQRRR